MALYSDLAFSLDGRYFDWIPRFEGRIELTEKYPSKWYIGLSFDWMWWTVFFCLIDV